jgi:hypothetical protein
MHCPPRQADLHLNGIAVGIVVAEGISDSWTYGKFTPNSNFVAFAQLFGVWSLLVHEDNGEDETPREALDELAIAETAIDRVKAELHWHNSDERTGISQLNIDGELIEWKPL